VADAVQEVPFWGYKNPTAPHGSSSARSLSFSLSIPSVQFTDPSCRTLPTHRGGPTSLKLRQSSLALHLLCEARGVRPSWRSRHCHPPLIILLRLSTAASIPFPVSISLPFSRPKSLQRNIGDCCLRDFVDPLLVRATPPGHQNEEMEGNGRAVQQRRDQSRKYLNCS
jgi:hypothetical protein